VLKQKIHLAYQKMGRKKVCRKKLLEWL